MNISFEVYDKGWLDKLAEIEAKMPQELDDALFNAAQYGISIILDRTEKGQGQYGAFAPYSITYAQAKREGWPRSKGRSAFSGDPSGVVNLTVTGRMLASMKANRGRGFAEIRFSSKAQAAKAYFNDKLPNRKFFGFSRSETQSVLEVVKKRLLA